MTESRRPRASAWSQAPTDPGDGSVSADNVRIRHAGVQAARRFSALPGLAAACSTSSAWRRKRSEGQPQLPACRNGAGLTRNGFASWSTIAWYAPEVEGRDRASTDLPLRQVDKSHSIFGVVGIYVCRPHLQDSKAVALNFRCHPKKAEAFLGRCLKFGTVVQEVLSQVPVVLLCSRIELE